jgi:hypothetical protein
MNVEVKSASLCERRALGWKQCFINCAARPGVRLEEPWSFLGQINWFEIEVRSHTWREPMALFNFKSSVDRGTMGYLCFGFWNETSESNLDFVPFEIIGFGILPALNLIIASFQNTTKAIILLVMAFAGMG